MKNLIIILVIFLSSCGPASYGVINKNDKGCSVLTNTSSSDKIVFVMKFDTIDYKWEETVGPQEDRVIECEGAGVSIISAYIKN